MASKDVKGPVPFRNESNRSKQKEVQVPFYLDLESGKICADNYVPTPVGETEQFNVHIDGTSGNTRADCDMGKSKATGISKRKITSVKDAQ